MKNQQDEFLERIFQLAEEALVKKDHEAHAMELFRYYLSIYPDDTKARVMYGEALRILGKYEEAFSAIKQAFDETQNQKNKGQAAIKLAMLLAQHVSPSEAKKWYEKATHALGEDFGWSWILRGANLAVLGEFEEAIICYKTVIQNNAEEKDEALLNLGLVYRAMGKYDEAIVCLRQALDIDPSYEEAHTILQGLESINDTLALIQASNHLKNPVLPHEKEI